MTPTDFSALPADAGAIGTACVLDGCVTVAPTARLGAGVLVQGPCEVHAGARVEAGARLVARATSPTDTLVIQANAQVEAGALVVGAITIGHGAVVRAGAVVTQSVPPHAIVEGAPARITGYVDAGQTQAGAAIRASEAFALGETVRTLDVGRGPRAVQLHQLTRVQDMRGDLSVGEFAHDIPFEAQRYFLVYNVPSEHTRGAHAHRQCHQFLICVAGSCAVVVDDGASRAEVLLDAPHLGLYMPPMTWGIQYKYSPGAVLLVYASHRYDPDDYIREYAAFTDHLRAENPDTPP